MQFLVLLTVKSGTDCHFLCSFTCNFHPRKKQVIRLLSSLMFITIQHTRLNMPQDIFYPLLWEQMSVAFKKPDPRHSAESPSLWQLLLANDAALCAEWLQTLSLCTKHLTLQDRQWEALVLNLILNPTFRILSYKKSRWGRAYLNQCYLSTQKRKTTLLLISPQMRKLAANRNSLKLGEGWGKCQNQGKKNHLTHGSLQRLLSVDNKCWAFFPHPHKLLPFLSAISIL